MIPFASSYVHSHFYSFISDGGVEDLRVESDSKEWGLNCIITYYFHIQFLRSLIRNFQSYSFISDSREWDLRIESDSEERGLNCIITYYFYIQFLRSLICNFQSYSFINGSGEWDLHVESDIKKGDLDAIITYYFHIDFLRYLTCDKHIFYVAVDTECMNVRNSLMRVYVMCVCRLMCSFNVRTEARLRRLPC